jgi:hypothetical protein
MMRQEPRQVLRTIKIRVRFNAFTYSAYAFEAMVDQSLYEEDVKRAVASARLVETRESPQLGTCYVLQGFAMSEDEIQVVCRLLRQRVEVIDLSRSP